MAEERWEINVKNTNGMTGTVNIDEDATVRKLYKTIRRNFGFMNSFQLFIDDDNPLVKDDRRMSTVGLYNGITLTAAAQSEPYSWDLFVKLPGKSTTNTVTLYESQTCEDLYKKVMQLHGNRHPLCIKDPLGDDIPDDKSSLFQHLYDGASLTSEYALCKTLIVAHSHSSFTIQVSPDCFVSEVFQEVRKKFNGGDLEEVGLITGMKYLNNYMHKRITDSEISLSHGSCISIVVTQRGGSDPRVQMLQNCESKDVIGVITPSMRACPYCGALVQHIDACKQMNCPACSKAFCFICLKKNDGGGWQCGNWNTRCTPAPRQTHIPG